MRYKKTWLCIANFLVVLLVAVFLSLLFNQTVQAISESDVQTKVAAAGKEAVSGNVFIWFLCAVAFLKVSQKIDSFMSSLGINVGHTGGSLMAEAMIAARGIGTAKNISGRSFGGGSSGWFRGKGGAGTSNSGMDSAGRGSSGGSGFLTGGLAGVVSRNLISGAKKSATRPTGSAGTVGSRMYASSVGQGGRFANNVIGAVATGNIKTDGMITGSKAAEALHSYTGNAALEPGTANIPQFSNVEIGGGRITGTEVSADSPDGMAFGMYHTAQYTKPEGSFSTVQTTDGESWYKQYAVNGVARSPYLAPDGSIAYQESIVKKLPSPPPRKERL